MEAAKAVPRVPLFSHLDLRYQPAPDGCGTVARSRNFYTLYPELARFVRIYDPNLKVVWDDWRQRWRVWRESQGKDHFVFTVENEDGSYRDLDQGFFETLFRFDALRRFGTPDRFARALEVEQEEADEKAVADWEDDFDHACRDNRRQLSAAYEAALDGNLPPGDPPRDPNAPRIVHETMKVRERYVLEQATGKLRRTL